MAKNESIERRTFATDVELREGETGKRGFGHFAVFNQRAEILPGIFEEILPGAFDDVLSQDIRVLFNHNPDKIIARTSNKTASLGVDEKGGTVDWSFPNNTTGNDLRESMERGDIREMSFGFVVGKGNDKWSSLGNGQELRTISRFKKIMDTSPVTFAAYPTTDVALRSLEEWRKEHETKPEDSAHDDLADVTRKNNERKRKLSLLKHK